MDKNVKLVWRNRLWIWNSRISNCESILWAVMTCSLVRARWRDFLQDSCWFSLNLHTDHDHIPIDSCSMRPGFQHVIHAAGLLLLPGFFLGLLHHENEGNMWPQNVSRLLPNYTVLQPRSMYGCVSIFCVFVSNCLWEPDACFI